MADSVELYEGQVIVSGEEKFILMRISDEELIAVEWNIVNELNQHFRNSSLPPSQDSDNLSAVMEDILSSILDQIFVPDSETPITLPPLPVDELFQKFFSYDILADLNRQLPPLSPVSEFPVAAGIKVKKMVRKAPIYNRRKMRQLGINCKSLEKEMEQMAVSEALKKICEKEIEISMIPERRKCQRRRKQEVRCVDWREKDPIEFTEAIFERIRKRRRPVPKKKKVASPVYSESEEEAFNDPWGAIGDEMDMSEMSSSDSDVDATCEFCGKICISHTFLRKHLKMVHSDKKQDEKPTEIKEEVVEQMEIKQEYSDESFEEPPAKKPRLDTLETPVRSRLTRFAKDRAKRLLFH